MAKIVRARHVSYTGPGEPYQTYPVVRLLEDIYCLNDRPEFPGARQFDYTPTGLPLLRYPYKCCDCFCDDAQEAADDCYVEPECWPYGEGPGIMRKVCAYVTEITNCISARSAPKPGVLEYNDGTGKWEGSVELRGGTLTLAWECVPNPDPEVIDPTFKLTVGGCATTADYTFAPTCEDPIDLAYQVSNIYQCCDCGANAPPTPTTNISPEVTVNIRANCRKKVWWARHVDYTDSGFPVVAMESKCNWDGSDNVECGTMQCPICTTWTPITEGCEDLSGTFRFSYEFVTSSADSIWTIYDTPPGNISSAQISCVDLGFDTSTGYKMVKLTMLVACQADNSGYGETAPFPAKDLEDLDQTLTLSMVWNGENSSQCCVGDIEVRLTRLSNCGGVSLLAARTPKQEQPDDQEIVVEPAQVEQPAQEQPAPKKGCGCSKKLADPARVKALLAEAKKHGYKT